jgi:tetratricopeptide (TPR) repeat protein
MSVCKEYTACGKYKSAVNMLKQLPESAEKYFELGKVYYLLHDYKNALKYLPCAKRFV